MALHLNPSITEVECISCSVCKARYRVGPRDLCILCSYLIPSYIPKKQYKMYLSKLIYSKYNHTIYYKDNDVMSDTSLRFLSDLVVEHPSYLFL